MLKNDQKALYLFTFLAAIFLIIVCSLIAVASDVNVISITSASPGLPDVNDKKFDPLSILPLAALAASEILPFLPNKSQGLLHAIIRTVRLFFVKRKHESKFR